MMSLAKWDALAAEGKRLGDTADRIAVVSLPAMFTFLVLMFFWPVFFAPYFISMIGCLISVVLNARAANKYRQATKELYR